MSQALHVATGDRPRWRTPGGQALDQQDRRLQAAFNAAMGKHAQAFHGALLKCRVARWHRDLVLHEAPALVLVDGRGLRLLWTKGMCERPSGPPLRARHRRGHYHATDARTSMPLLIGSPCHSCACYCAPCSRGTRRFRRAGKWMGRGNATNKKTRI